MLINPVLRRENRTILRTWKTYIAIMAYVLILLAVAAFVIYALYNNSLYSGINPSDFSAMFIALSGVQLGMTLLIVPALTGASISGERERQTLDLMLTTKMSPFSIVVGRMLSSIIVAVIMVVAAMPIFAICMYYGAISIIGVLLGMVFTLIMAFFSGCVGIFFSTVFKKTVVSIVVSFITVISFCLLPFVVVLICLLISQYNDNTIGSYFMDVAMFVVNYIAVAFTPFGGFMSICDNQFGYSIIYEMLSAASHTYNGINTVSNNDFFMGISRFMWLFNILVCSLLSCMFLLLSAHIINPVKSRRG